MYRYLLGGLAVVTTIGLAAWHYTSLVSNNKRLTVELSRADDRIDRIEFSLENQQRLITEASANSRLAQQDLRRIEDVFSRHDFQYLLDKKPGLIVRRVNSGTVTAFELLECETDIVCSAGH